MPKKIDLSMLLALIDKQLEAEEAESRINEAERIKAQQVIKEIAANLPYAAPDIQVMLIEYLAACSMNLPELLHTPEFDPQKRDMPPFYGFNPLKVDFRQIEKRAASQMELFAQVFYYGYESDKSFRTEIIKDANYSLSQSYLTNTVYDGFMRARGKYISSPFALDTACTDGLNIYINPFMAASMTTGELIFVMSHELLHILLGHLIPDNSSKKFAELGLSDTRDIAYELANISLDLGINDMLVHDKVGLEPLTTSGDHRFCCINGFKDYNPEAALIVLTNIEAKLVMSLFPKIFNNLTFNDMYEADTLQGAKKLLDDIYTNLMDYASNGNGVEFDEEMLKKCMDEIEKKHFFFYFHHEKFHPLPADSALAFSKDIESEMYRYAYSTLIDLLNRLIGRKNENDRDGENSDEEADRRQGNSGGQGKGTQQGGDSDPSETSNSNGSKEKGSETGSATQTKSSNDKNGERGVNNGKETSQKGGSKKKPLTKEEFEQFIKDFLRGNLGNAPLDDHKASYEKVKERGEGSFDKGMEESMEDSNLTNEEIIRELERMGVSKDDLMNKMAGNIGAQCMARWKAARGVSARPYDKELFNLFQRMRGNQYETYRRFSKKTSIINQVLKQSARNKGQAPKKIAIPTRDDAVGKLLIGIDTSGSIFYDKKSMTLAASETLRLCDMLMKKYKGYEIEIVTCDTRITQRKSFKGGSSELRSYIDELQRTGIELTGAGGTDLLPVFELISDPKERQRIPYTGMVFITDTQTLKGNEIANLYSNGTIKIPTVILVPKRSDVIQDWARADEECSNFTIIEMDKLRKQGREEEISPVENAPER